MEKVTWGIIGVGDVCEKKSAPAMQKIANSEIKSVMRRDLAKAADYAKRHQVSHYTNDAEVIFNDPEINAIYIATPPSSHEELALRAASVGKATYVEKPMATNYNACLKMVTAFKEADLPLYIAYYRRALPNFLKIKELIEQKVIGDIRFVNVQLIQPLKDVDVVKDAENWRVDPKISGGGYFHDLAAHQLDFLDFLLGPIKTAKGITANQAGLYHAEDIVSATWQFENDIIGNGTWCFTASEIAGKEFTTIVGEKGKIEYATFESSDVALYTVQGGKQVFQFDMPEYIQQPLIQSIVDELRGVGTSPSTGISAARTNYMMDLITENT
ncbi:MAG: Gfo/Idh/MocA family oxidoreductase [Bacteroidota bacterium]